MKMAVFFNSLRQATRRLELESLEQRRLLTGVVINEIHYDPDIDTEQVEFIELYNAGSEAVNLSGWRIDDAVDYVFADGTTLEGDAFLVVTENARQFERKFGRAADGEWEAGDKLRNDGERIVLLDAADGIVDEVEYQLGFPWPIVGDRGRSIELRNPFLDNSRPGNWTVSSMRDEDILVPEDATWEYRKGTSNPPSDWSENSFDTATDDVPWQSGQASIGYGDNDDKTVLSDMRGSYSTLYLRHEFQIGGELPNDLLLRLYVDDGAIIYINGQEVARRHVSGGAKNFASIASNHEAEWEEVLLARVRSKLVVGNNVLAVHALNQSSSSSDFSFNAELRVATSQLATPGQNNSMRSENTGPHLERLRQSVQQPHADEDVVISVRVQDADGIKSVDLEYQIVEPGAYIRRQDPAYETNWTVVALRDDGQSGDVRAHDGVYSVTMPGSLHEHRQLVRYRIKAVDNLDNISTGPRPDDPQPNFAYFVYDGIPDWIASNRGRASSPKTTFSSELLDNGVAAYYLLADSTDVTRSQYDSSYRGIRFEGTLVYDGHVYDHVEFSNRGEASTYVSGKNKWRVDFLRGHDFAARDNYGNPYQEKWRRLTLNANASPWSPRNRGITGLDESVSNRLYQLAGVAAPNTNYVQFRVIDDELEAPANQYSGDFWGLYLAVEHTGGRFLKEHALAEGNVYEIEGGNGDARHLAPGQPTNGSDWSALKRAASRSTTSEAYWRANLNLDAYYSFRAINRAVANIDLRDGANYVMYHAPNGLWEPIPWDLDMMYAPETHWSGETYFASALRHDEIELEFRNRSRELLDLLFSDASRTGGQIAQLVDEYARFVNPVEADGGFGLGWAEADQYAWNYHPRTASNHRGAFFKTPFQESRRGGTWTRRLDSADFDGMVKYIIDFMTDTDPGSWRVGDGDQRGYGFNYLEFEAKDPHIPATPTIQYTGGQGFPLNEIAFSTSEFSDPDGDAFDLMEWRIAEISNPATPTFDSQADWLYEIDPTWESGELDAFKENVEIPASRIQAGHTYRARVRMRDETGRWSHWSAPVEFVAAKANLAPTLAITEIHYHPADTPLLENEEDQEFIEIFNIGSEAVDLSAHQIQDFANEPFAFSSGQILEPGEYVIVARSPAAFKSIYGPDLNVYPVGYATRNLGNRADTVTLVSPHGVTLSRVSYTDRAPWDDRADGSGYSLEILDVRRDADDATNWRASQQLGGSPGRRLPVPKAGDVNLDGLVSFADFLILSANFGRMDAVWADGDFNNDGTVNFTDFLLLSANFGD